MPRMRMIQADRSGRLRPSFTQEERLLAGREAFFPNNVLVFGLDIRGPLDTALMRRCVHELVQRHESLRTVFPEGDDGPEAAILPAEAAVEITETDLRQAEPSEEAMAQAKEAVAQTAARPFHLATGPLLRVLLVRISPGRALMGFALDHLVADGQSCDVVRRDLLTLYERHSRREAPQLPELPVQFMDFAASERHYLQGENLERLIGHWRRTLDGVDPIPGSGLVDPDAPADEPPRLKVHRHEVDASAMAGLRESVRATRSTTPALFAACLKTVVRDRRRKLGHDAEAAADVAVMGSLANRMHLGLEHAVGYFATPCVFRTSFPDDPPLLELAKRENGVIFAALRHQEIPHALITRLLNPAQYGARHRPGLHDVPPYVNFDVADVAHSRSRTVGELLVETVRIPRPEVPRGGIRVLVRQGAESASVELRVRSDHYGDAWASSFLDDYVRTLRSVPYAASTDT